MISPLPFGGFLLFFREEKPLKAKSQTKSPLSHHKVRFSRSATPGRGWLGGLAGPQGTPRDTEYGARDYGQVCLQANKTIQVFSLTATIPGSQPTATKFWTPTRGGFHYVLTIAGPCCPLKGGGWATSKIFSERAPEGV